MISTLSEIAPNWAISDDIDALDSIHQDDVNIAIYTRDTSNLESEINSLLDQNIECKASGDIDSILGEIAEIIDPNRYPLVMNDVRDLLSKFQKVSQSESSRLLIATVNSNMCRKFHTDLNDLRMLCTYSGPGTLWLTEDNVDRSSRDTTALRENDIQQVATGDVAILKGAIYPNVQSAIVHRSPTIEETGEKRLLLRIDTNANQKLWR